MPTQFDEEKQNKQLDELRKQEEEELVATLAESKYGLPYIDLYRLGIDNEALAGNFRKRRQRNESGAF